jgi:hypothetical protein
MSHFTWFITFVKVPNPNFTLPKQGLPFVRKGGGKWRGERGDRFKGQDSCLVRFLTVSLFYFSQNRN